MKKSFLFLLSCFVLFLSLNVKGQNANVSRFSKSTTRGYVTNGSDLPFVWYDLDFTVNDSATVNTSAFENYITLKNISNSFHLKLDTLIGNVYKGDIVTIDADTTGTGDTLFVYGGLIRANSGSDTVIVFNSIGTTIQYIWNGSYFLKLPNK